MTNSCGLYRSEFEHDACGVGFIAHIKGQKSHSIVSQALDVLKNLRHRGAVGADPLQGDGGLPSAGGGFSSCLRRGN